MLKYLMILAIMPFAYASINYSLNYDICNLNISGSLPIDDGEIYASCSETVRYSYVCNCSPINLTIANNAINNYTLEMDIKSSSTKSGSSGGGGGKTRKQIITISPKTNKTGGVFFSEVPKILDAKTPRTEPTATPSPPSPPIKAEEPIVVNISKEPIMMKDTINWWPLIIIGSIILLIGIAIFGYTIYNSNKEGY